MTLLVQQVCDILIFILSVIKFLIRSKAALVNRLKMLDLHFFTAINHRLTHANDFFVTSLVTAPLERDDSGSTVVSSVDGVNVTRTIIRQLDIVGLIEEDCMSVVIALLCKRNDRIVTAYSDIHDSAPTFVRLKSNLFFQTNFFNFLNSEGIHAIDELKVLFPQLGQDSKMIGYICIVIKKDAYWDVLIICSETKTIQFIHHRPGDTGAIKNRYEEVFNTFANQYFSSGVAVLWQCSYYSVTNLIELANDFDSGMLAIASLYYLAAESPITTKVCDLQNLRKKIAYWMLSEMLPM